MNWKFWEREKEIETVELRIVNPIWKYKRTRMIKELNRILKSFEDAKGEKLFVESITIEAGKVTRVVVFTAPEATKQKEAKK